VSVAACAALLLSCQGGGSGGGPESAKKGQTMTEESVPRGTVPPGKNRLALEHSPYLLQHADNPVDWYPWGEEAFAAAKAQDKPIFLSIGYSTCHWCHVMEHESFEDPEVAALLNDAFICIKVDREERPDVDAVYMAVCQMLTGRGGWPLTILMTPAKHPFFAATYIPRSTMVEFIPRVKEAWHDSRDKVLSDATRLTAALRGAMAPNSGAAIGVAEVDSAYQQLSARFDSTNGGFGTAPKFPTPHNLLFLLRRWKRTGDPEALGMVERTLDAMRGGGVYDQVGFGFHRYSTDERWFLPHFEKMLYDQALMAMAYTEAYQATGHGRYRRTAEEIFTYVMRDMSDPVGGFYSAEDADSDGEEGKFYLWTTAELRSVLGDDADLAISFFGVKDAGNFIPEGAPDQGGANENVLYRSVTVSREAAAMGVSEDALEKRIESIRGRLFAAREARVHPAKDDKVMTDWNGLMIAALAKAARAFDEPQYARRAEAAARFVLDKMASPDGGLLHRYRSGDASIEGMVDDYAFFVWGLVELYETTFDVAYLEKAVGFAERMLGEFWDTNNGGLFFAPRSGDDLIVRPKEVYDGAAPSGNSVAMLELTRLARLTGRTEFEDRARAIGAAFQEQVSKGPSAYTMLMCGVDYLTGPAHEVVIVGRPGAPDVNAMSSALNGVYAPNEVVVFRPAEGADRVVKIAPYTKDQKAVDGKATAYVCRNFACDLPTTSVDTMLATLGRR